MNYKRSLFVLIAVVLFGWLSPGDSFALTVVGGGESVITGGNGAATLGDLMPVKTLFAFVASREKGGVATGRFECLALAPPAASGADSGQFTTNVMYVTGVITSLERLNKKTFLLKGQGRCSGLGAGDGVQFEATVTLGGAGATIRLTVDTLPGIEFFEVVTSGSISSF